MHQCVKCNKIFEDGSGDLLKGCSGCGGKFFFYIKKQHLEEVQEEVTKLTFKEREKIQRDVFDIVGAKLEDDKPVVLDFESIKVLKPGKFEVDVVNLMKGKPVIFRMEEGKYVIDLAGTFQQIRKQK
ncbi:MAG: Zn-ribbon domain-containing protein [Nanoarchaeota archaeon]|nr:Zn-ribbon domain-containing protein [Nanoarchaeota archaeon]